MYSFVECSVQSGEREQYIYKVDLLGEVRCDEVEAKPVDMQPKIKQNSGTIASNLTKFVKMMAVLMVWNIDADDGSGTTGLSWYIVLVED